MKLETLFHSRICMVINTHSGRGNNTRNRVSRISLEKPGNFICFRKMQVMYYPSKRRVNTSIKNDDPLLLLVSINGERMIVSNIDDSMEHHILLKQVGFSENDLEKYFRIVVNRSEASWTYVCPNSYLKIKNRALRLKKYFENGIDEITKALKLLQYDVPIEIPARYRRHFETLQDEETG